MSFLSSELGLSLDELIQVRVSASNMMGQGAWSVTNSLGALVRSVP